jgi:parvulin-like peptidyl-prolyl isomerase
LPRTRSRRGLLVGAIATIVLAACSSGPAGPLATVDGVEIPREQLEAWIRSASDANEDIDPVGLQAELLSWAIQVRVFEGVLAERGLTIDPALLQQTRDGVVAQVGGDAALEVALADIGFPRDFFENVFLVQQAALDALAIELAEGRSLETRTARHILVETREEAEEVYALLLEGADFAELAQERSQDPGSSAAGGVLGPQERGLFVPPFDDAVWSAPLDTVLEPVESDFGFHVIEVIEIAARPASLLSSQERQSLVFAELSAIIDAALSAAVVTIDPTIGTWDALGARVLPVGRSN